MSTITGEMPSLEDSFWEFFLHKIFFYHTPSLGVDNIDMITWLIFFKTLLYVINIIKYLTKRTSRKAQHVSGYGAKLSSGECWNGYVRRDEEELDTEWKKYRINNKDEMKLRKLVKSMIKGKVIATNVVCLALGFLHILDRVDSSFGKLAVLLKLMNILGTCLGYEARRNHANNLSRDSC